MISTIIRNRFMHFNPVKLSSILDHFEGFEDIASFYGLVQDYMPEEKARLLQMTHGDAAKEFAQMFSKRYFSIEEPSSGYNNAGTGGLHRLTQQIALNWHGMDERDYEPAGPQNYRNHRMAPAQLLAETICVCPFNGERQDRLAVVAEFSRILDGRKTKPLLKLLPPEGMLVKDVAATLQGTEYAGLILWCRWVFHETGNHWLDTVSREPLAWSKTTVTNLAAEWKPYLQLDNEMQHFNNWLKKDFPGRTAEIIRYLGEHRPKYLVETMTGDVNAE